MSASIPVEPPAISLHEDPIWIAIESDQMSGSPGAYTPDEPNLSAYIEIYDVDNSETLIALNAPYSKIDKRAKFNLRSLFNLKPHIPDDDAILADTAIKWGLASNSFLNYKIKYADQYGNPATPEALEETANSSQIIYGGRSKGSSDYSPMSGNGLILHRFRDQFDVSFPIPTTKDQPQFCYFWQASNANDAIFDVLFYYTDGTNETVEVSKSDMPTLSGKEKVYWCQCGWDQLELGDLADPAKTVYKYRLLLRSSSQPAELIDVMDFELVTDYEDHELFLLVPNGFGGMESVRCKGKRKYNALIDRVLSDSVEWDDFDVRSGSMGQVSQLGTNEIVVNTGFYPRGYIYHLRQLLRGEVWLMNTVRNRFEKYLVTSTEIPYHDDNELLWSFEIKIRPAWHDFHFNNFEI